MFDALFWHEFLSLSRFSSFTLCRWQNTSKPCWLNKQVNVEISLKFWKTHLLSLFKLTHQFWTSHQHFKGIFYLVVSKGFPFLEDSTFLLFFRVLSFRSLRHLITSYEILIVPTVWTQIFRKLLHFFFSFFTSWRKMLGHSWTCLAVCLS